jgi:hypothetical protein
VMITCRRGKELKLPTLVVLAVLLFTPIVIQPFYPVSFLF